MGFPAAVWKTYGRVDGYYMAPLVH